MSDSIELTDAEAQFAEAFGMDAEEYKAYSHRVPDGSILEARSRRIAAEEALKDVEERLRVAEKHEADS